METSGIRVRLGDPLHEVLGSSYPHYMRSTGTWWVSKWEMAEEYDFGKMFDGGDSFFNLIPWSLQIIAGSKLLHWRVVHQPNWHYVSRVGSWFLQEYACIGNSKFCYYVSAIGSSSSKWWVGRSQNLESWQVRRFFLQVSFCRFSTWWRRSWFSVS